MRRIIKTLFLTTIFAISPVIYAQKNKNFDENFEQLTAPIFKNRWDLSITQKKYLRDKTVIVNSKVESIEQNSIKSQRLSFKVAAIHPRNCAETLKILSIYENYKNYIDFIKVSTYDEKTKSVYFILDSAILPFRMSLAFYIPRITGPGIYPFQFTNGIFKNLSGNIEVYDINSSCLFFTYASWIGPKTKIPDIIIEMFSETLTRKSFEKLFRISSL